MKTTMKLISIVAISIMIAAFANASTSSSGSKCLNCSKNYIRLDGAYSQPLKKVNSDYLKKHKAAPGVSAGFGYIINDNLRVDLTGTYRGQYKYSASWNGVSQTQKIESAGLMLSGYFDIKKFGKFTPYAMIGGGYMYNGLKDNLTSTIAERNKLNRTFAWQAGAGSRCNIMNNLDIDLMYKYVDLGDAHVKNAEKGKLRVHELSLGIIYII